jgi:hypothetical protein
LELTDAKNGAKPVWLPYLALRILRSSSMFTPVPSLSVSDW